MELEFLFIPEVSIILKVESGRGEVFEARATMILDDIGVSSSSVWRVVY
jgi:hypothetical protein